MLWIIFPRKKNPPGITCFHLFHLEDILLLVQKDVHVLLFKDLKSKLYIYAMFSRYLRNQIYQIQLYDWHGISKNCLNGSWQSINLRSKWKGLLGASLFPKQCDDCIIQLKVLRGFECNQIWWNTWNSKHIWQRSMSLEEFVPWHLKYAFLTFFLYRCLYQE